MRLLAAAGWNSPDPHQYPTGAELVERYLDPLARRTALADHIETSSRVTAISRAGFDKLKTRGREQAPFEIRYQNGAGPKTHPRRRGHRRVGNMVVTERRGGKRSRRDRRTGGA